MILVFIILGIIILSGIVAFVLMLSTLKFEIQKLHITNEAKKIKADFILDIAIYLFNRFKMIHYQIDNIKMNNLLSSGKIDIQKLKDNHPFNKELIRLLKDSNFRIEYFKIEGYFATFNTVLSSSIYAILNAVIPIIIAPKMHGKYMNHTKFLNTSENIININLNCIISEKLVNIINTLHYLKKKGGKENNGKSSDRRAYAYSHE